MTMLSSDNTINTIVRLVENSHRYTEMKMEHLERTTVKRLTSVISFLLMAAVIFIVGSMAALIFCAALIVALAPHVGGYIVAMAIVGGVLLLALLYVYARRHRMIVRPLERIIASMILAEKADTTGPAQHEVEEVENDIVRDFHSLTTPPTPARNKFEEAVNAASRAWTIADALIMGYKLYRKLGKKGRRRF